MNTFFPEASPGGNKVITRYNPSNIWVTSGGIRFQAAIDIHVHRNGEGRISFFPGSYSMAKARTPKSPCDIFFRVEGTRFFFVYSSPFAVVVSKHSEDWL